jgi:SAM-dependent methyltransferase
MQSDARCHHCGSPVLKAAIGYDQTLRVTSDCKPWKAGGVLAFCQECGLVQRIVDANWDLECNDIYTGYSIYHQSEGIEQAVFDSTSGKSQTRSDAIIDTLLTKVNLAESGRWLDIGCGNGALLRSCSRALPQWSLCGSEVNDKYKKAVESIRGVACLFVGALDDIPGEFDVISAVHVIEHIPHPSSLLREVAKKLKPDGLLFIEVPDCRKNPFMLTVADHCSHFSLGMMASVVASSGYTVLCASDSWISKEISVLAHAGACQSTAETLPDAALLKESQDVFTGWDELKKTLAKVDSLTGTGGIGIFGTSIAATWLSACAQKETAFFVDEDRSRIGRLHMGHPILSTEQIPDAATVFIALPTSIAKGIASRLQIIKPHARFITP